jgi:protein tyrosine phosphatase (PTP) superfamily phosphohydrolase (DUF442 family)
MMSFESLAHIEAFVLISPHLATSGQPTAAQFASIQAAGYAAVLNLAMPSSSNWLPDEAVILDRLGMAYFYIPVLWENPVLDDFEQFCQVLEQHKAAKLWVHCAKNMRVSAMLYLYHRLQVGMSHEVAQRYLTQVWHPDPVWQGFIEAVLGLNEN